MTLLPPKDNFPVVDSSFPPPAPDAPILPPTGPPYYLDGFHCYICDSHFIYVWWHRLWKRHRPQLVPPYEE